MISSSRLFLNTLEPIHILVFILIIARYTVFTICAPLALLMVIFRGQIKEECIFLLVKRVKSTVL